MKIKRILKASAVILVALATIILIFGYAAGEQQYSFDTVIEAPVEKTWNTFQNPMYFSTWMDGFQEIEMLDGNPGMPGSVYKITFLHGNTESHLVEKVTISDPPVQFAFDIENSALIGHVDVQLSQNNDGHTVLTNTVNYRGTNPFWNALIALGQSNIKDGDQGNFTRLKEFIESK